MNKKNRAKPFSNTISVETNEGNTLTRFFNKKGNIVLVSLRKRNSAFPEWIKSYRSNGEIWLKIYKDRMIVSEIFIGVAECLNK